MRKALRIAVLLLSVAAFFGSTVIPVMADGDPIPSCNPGTPHCW